jgi:microcystin degradation protein MlrC
MRLAALGVPHETNVFASRPTGYDRFLATGIYRGHEIARAFRDAQSTMAGFLEAGEQDGVEVVPLFFTQTEPLGTITDDAFERIVGEMLALLVDRGLWDGVPLALHGAAVSEAHPDMADDCCDTAGSAEAETVGRNGMEESADDQAGWA